MSNVNEIIESKTDQINGSLDKLQTKIDVLNNEDKFYSYEKDQNGVFKAKINGIKLDVSFYKDFKEKVQYFPAPFIFKNVVYFLAEAISNEVKIQDDEVLEYKWVNYEEASKLISYKVQKNILKKANDILEGTNQG